ncbi:hypothetical protein C8R47DRAFT_1205760 [Mycena vitilis]|nr:hypothetical protein C8R47DRAFT_1205760 [Mycena vitilis]
MVKKQDSWTGPTGSRNPKHLAEVVVLDDGIAIDCRRSNLSCGAFFTCSMAASDYLEGFERSEDDSEDLVSAPVRAAKSAEAGSLIAIATEFYQSVNSKYCTAQAANETFPCGGHAVMRKFTHGATNGKLSFIGCSNWSANDDVKHRFTKIPHSVRESILRNIFRGEPIEVDDDDVVLCREFARQFDCDNARVIKASIEFGVWENGNNSIRARFTSQAARQSRAHNKKAVAAMSEKGTKKLKDQLKVAERRAQEQEQEIQRLQTQLGLEPTPSTPQAGPSRILRTPSTPEQYIDVDHRTPSRPLRMKALDIFSGLRPMTPIAEPRSDFDYAGALNSDILDSTLQRIQDAHPMYPVNGDEEILASDPYPVPR